MLIVDNISFFIDNRIIFKNVSFELHSGCILKLIGANGSGKTTLLRILAGLNKTKSGSIFWNFFNIDKNLSYYLDDIIFISHKQNLHFLLTPLENISFQVDIFNSIKIVSVDDALVYMGLNYNLMNSYSYKLSAGESQRVILSRLLINSSKLWILDEPFSYLDFESIILLNKIISNFLFNGGIVILSDHSNVILNLKIDFLLNLELYK